MNPTTLNIGAEEEERRVLADILRTYISHIPGGLNHACFSAVNRQYGLLTSDKLLTQEPAQQKWRDEALRALGDAVQRYEQGLMGLGYPAVLGPAWGEYPVVLSKVMHGLAADREETQQVVDFIWTL